MLHHSRSDADRPNPTTAIRTLCVGDGGDAVADWLAGAAASIVPVRADADARVPALLDAEGPIETVVVDADAVDAVAVTRRVREADERLPVVVCARSPDPSLIDRALSAGATDVTCGLEAPARRRLLADRVERAGRRYLSRHVDQRFERRFEAIADVSAAPVWSWRLDADAIRGYGDVAARLGYDLSTADVTVEWWFDRVHPDDRERVAEALRADVADGDTTLEPSYRVRRADGSYAAVSERWAVLADARGEPRAVVGGLRDVAAAGGSAVDRASADGSASDRSSADRTSTDAVGPRAAAAAPVGLAVVEREGAIAWANDAAATLLGAPASGLGGESLAAVLDDEFPALEATVDEPATVTATDASGERRVLDAVARELPASAEAGDRLVALWDVTARHERERALADENDRLDRFAGVVSHDLRNPLTTARGFTEQAAHTGDLSYLDRVTDAHDWMERIIDDALALARTGTVVESTDPVALAATVRSCTGCVDRDAVDVRIEATPDRTVEADPDRLRQLLENLLRNAVEHGSTSPDSQARQDAVEHDSTSPSNAEDASVTVWIGALEDGFYVEDDGPGIPPDERAEVFDPGYTTATRGTGFGLHIVEQIAEAHDWDASITSGRAGGARFEFHTG